MGILSSSASITRYIVEGSLQTSVLDTVRKGLQSNVIKEIDNDIEDNSVGWTSFFHPFNPRFDDTSFMIGTYLIFSLRIDKKSIPAKVLKKHCDRRIEQKLAKEHRQYLSRDEKKIIKDQVIQELNRRIPASPSIFNLVWSHEERWLWFFTTQKAANEMLESIFKRSFHLSLIRVIPYTMAGLRTKLSAIEQDSLNNLSPTSFQR